MGGWRWGRDGALRAAIEARDAGLVRFLGVTGHGTRVAAMHLRSLERFAFDSVLLPYNPAMMRDAALRARTSSGSLARLPRAQRRRADHQVVARRRWPEGAAPTHDTWYEPLTDPAEIERAVHWALARPGVFVNSAGDLRLLAPMLRAAESFEARHAAAEAPPPEPPRPRAALRAGLRGAGVTESPAPSPGALDEVSSGS